MSLFTEHTCGDSKLKCIDCDKQICPKCLVQCPVGNRCNQCTKRFTSHVLQVDPGCLSRGLMGGFIAGAIFSVADDYLPTWGFYIYIFIYFIGAFVGNLIFKFAGRKIGRKIASAVAAGAILGGFAAIFGSSIFFSSMQDNTNQNLADSDEYQSTTIPEDDSEQGNKRHKIKHLARAHRNTAADAIALTQRPSLKPQPTFDLASDNPFSLAFFIYLLGLVSPFLGWSFGYPGLRR